MFAAYMCREEVGIEKLRQNKGRQSAGFILARVSTIDAASYRAASPQQVDRKRTHVFCLGEAQL